MNAETIFWICALAGSGFFLIKVVLGLVLGLDHDAAHGAADAHLHDAAGTEDAFKVFSFYSISAFLMMFGWAGLASLHQFQLAVPVSTIVALAVGVVTMWLTARLFSAMRLFTSPGSQFHVEKLRGFKASVYQRIPGGDKSGVIQVTVEGILREVEALSSDQQPIDSFAAVEIIDIKSPHTVIVRKA